MSSEVLVKHATEIEDLGDYTERVKQLAARRQVDYADRDLLRSATDAALAAYRRKHPTFLQVVPPPKHREEPLRDESDPTRHVARGTGATLGELAESLKSGSVDELNQKVRQMSERRRA